MTYTLILIDGSQASRVLTAIPILLGRGKDGIESVCVSRNQCQLEFVAGCVRLTGKGGQGTITQPSFVLLLSCTAAGTMVVRANGEVMRVGKDESVTLTAGDKVGLTGYKVVPEMIVKSAPEFVQRVRHRDVKHYSE